MTTRAGDLPIPSSTRSHIALTTPFAQPPDCSTIRDLASLVTDYYDSILQSYSNVYLPGVLSNIEHPSFSSCQPKEWENILVPDGSGVSAIFFSPGVCPQDWETSFLSSSTRDGDVYSAGKCCMRGYTFRQAMFVPSTEIFCFSTFNPAQRVTHTATITTGALKGQETLLTNGIFIHPVWSIEWQDSDVPTLTPRPPILTEQIASYYTEVSSFSMPGPATTTSLLIATPTAANFHPAESNARRWLAIIIPMIFLAVFLACIAASIILLRRKRKAKVANEIERLRRQFLQTGQGHGANPDPNISTPGVVHDLGAPPPYRVN